MLDTHALIWFLEGDNQLSPKARAVIADPANRIFVSIASFWEIAIKVSIGKLNLTIPLASIIERTIEEDITILPIDLPHVLKILDLEQHHRDPFDRIIIALAICEGFDVVSRDEVFKDYPVNILW
ncbi:MAG: type II toxin-antitoxin system VapC family toxin [Saprospiraceae bacterium]